MSINHKILAIFREDENLRAAVTLLEKKGFDVVSETSVFQAIATITESKIDAIIRKSLDRVSHNGSVLNEGSKTHKSIEPFALRIAHEINNPLTTISGQLQLRLSEMESSDLNYHVFATLEEETQRIAETVRGLVTYAQLEDPDKEVVNLNDILKDIIYAFKDTEQEKEIRIVEAFDENLPVIMADKKQIALACKNIIDNSRKAINGKGGLKIATEKGRDNNITATFYDSGRGIPQDVIERIFDPFFVVNDEERGMGLGLCVSNDIIKRHGGALTVKSQVGKGTIFQFALPIESV